MAYVFNCFHWDEGVDSDALATGLWVLGDARYLKLDQTTPQTVVNGAPQFNKGVTIKENEWVYLDGV